METIQTSHKFDRQSCRPGDWVLAGEVPDWKLDRVIQLYSPPSQVLAAPFGTGPAVQPLPPRHEWVFRGSFFIDASGETVSIWRRGS